MPYLYGQPFKHELRTEINKLRCELSQERRERRLAQDRLVCARAKIRELEARDQEIVRQTAAIATLAAQPIQINVVEELQKERKRKSDEAAKAAETAEAA